MLEVQNGYLNCPGLLQAYAYRLFEGRSRDARRNQTTSKIVYVDTRACT